jgi:predicted kinase
MYQNGEIMEMTVGNLVKWFQLKYPKVVKDMHNSSHHFKDGEILNPYHLEGDVWTHNMMVMLEAGRLKDKCDHNMYPHVLVAALLHDIGKPLARKVNLEKERVHFWGHEPMSAILCVHILDKIQEDFNIRLNKRLIIEAIAMHTDVYNIPREKLEARLIGNTNLAQLLALLSDADYAGRFFDMGERNMEMIKPAHANSTAFYPREVICMVGLPCTGKSRYMNMFMIANAQEGGWEILSRDEIVLEVGKEAGFDTYDAAFKGANQDEVNARFDKRRRKLIKEGKNVIVDMTNMGRKSRKRNLQGFKGYRKSAVVTMTPIEEIHKRNEAREGKTIPDKVFERMITSFQPPLYDEFDEIRWEFN